MKPPKPGTLVMVKQEWFHPQEPPDHDILDKHGYLWATVDKPPSMDGALKKYLYAFKSLATGFEYEFFRSEFRTKGQAKGAE